MTTEGHLATLTQWSEWGKARFPTRVSRPDWSVVNALIEAAKPRLLQDSSILRELLDHSTDQLKLPDPLLFDFGVHRWLDRETSYSDWLAWVLERLGDAGAVLRVLGVQSTQFVPLRVGDYVVQRELQVEKGLSGCKGQIDLLIRFGERALHEYNDPEEPRAELGIYRSAQKGANGFYIYLSWSEVEDGTLLVEAAVCLYFATRTRRDEVFQALHRSAGCRVERDEGEYYNLLLKTPLKLDELGRLSDTLDLLVRNWLGYCESIGGLKLKKYQAS